MPTNKKALARYRIIDRMLADPNRTYTTSEMMDVLRGHGFDISLKMLQIDLNDFEEVFNMKLERPRSGKRYVRYVDQTQSLFNTQLHPEEKILLKEVLDSIGQFDGMENFAWLELMKRRLAADRNFHGEIEEREFPILSFGDSESQQRAPGLLGQLFTAISRKSVIEIEYHRFSEPIKRHVIYPYQLKRYNDRWYLLATDVGSERYPYDPGLVMNFPLDRITKVSYRDDLPYLECPFDLSERFDEIVGVTLPSDAERREIVFAVSESQAPFVESKFVHWTQTALTDSDAEDFKKKYPCLSSYRFYSIYCRENYELYKLFSSFRGELVVVSPQDIREHIRKDISSALEKYTD